MTATTRRMRPIIALYLDLHRPSCVSINKNKEHQQIEEEEVKEEEEEDPSLNEKEERDRTPFVRQYCPKKRG